MEIMPDRRDILEEACVYQRGTPPLLTNREAKMIYAPFHEIILVISWKSGFLSHRNAQLISLSGGILINTDRLKTSLIRCFPTVRDLGVIPGSFEIFCGLQISTSRLAELCMLKSIMRPVCISDSSSISIHYRRSLLDSPESFSWRFWFL